MFLNRKIFLLFAAFSLAVAPAAFAEGDTFCTGRITGTSVLSNPNAGQNYFDSHPGPTEQDNGSADLSIIGGSGELVPASREHAACINGDSGGYDGDSDGAIEANEYYDYSVKGYSWNDNLGFISYNCESGVNDAGQGDGLACGSIDYGVYIGAEDSSGERDLFGHAWSPSFGWIQFRGEGEEEEEAEVCISMMVPGENETVGPVTKGMGEAYSTTIGNTEYSVIANLSPSFPAELMNVTFKGVTQTVNDVNDMLFSGEGILIVDDLPQTVSFTLEEAYPAPVYSEEKIVRNGGETTVDFQGSDYLVELGAMNYGPTVTAHVNGLAITAAVGFSSNLFGGIVLEPTEIVPGSSMKFRLKDTSPEAVSSGPHQLPEGESGEYSLNNVGYTVTVSSINNSHDSVIEVKRTSNVSGPEYSVSVDETKTFSEVNLTVNEVIQKISYSVIAPGAPVSTGGCEEEEEEEEVAYNAVISCNPSAGGSPLNVTCTTVGSTAGADSVVWDFGDGSANSSNFEPMHQFNSATPNSPVTHNVTATLYWGNYSDSASTQVLERAPVVEIDYSANATCTPAQGSAPLNVTCTTAGSTEGADSVDGDFDDGTQNSSQHTPMHQFQDAGTYNVTLTLGWGNETETANVFVTAEEACVPTDDVTEIFTDGPVTTDLPGAAFVSLGDSQYEVSIEHHPENPDPRIIVTTTNINPFSTHSVSANEGEKLGFGDVEATVNGITQTATVTLAEKWAPLVTTINASDTATVSGYGEELEVTVLGVYGAPDDASVRIQVNGEVMLVDNHTNIDRGGYYLYVDDLQPFYNPPLGRFRILEEPGVITESHTVIVNVGESRDVIMREGDDVNEETLSVALSKIDASGNASIVVSDEWGPVGGRQEPIILGDGDTEPLSSHDLTLNSTTQEVTLSFEKEEVTEEGVSCPQASRNNLVASTSPAIESRIASEQRIAVFMNSMGLPPWYQAEGSFQAQDSDSGTFSYGVTMDADGFLHGYAWTEAGVWMNFEGVRAYLPGQIVATGPGWCDGKPWVCVEVRPNPLTLEFDAGSDEEIRIADGVDGYYVHLFVRDGTGQNALVPGQWPGVQQQDVNLVSFLMSIKVNWKDTVKIDQTIKATVGNSLNEKKGAWGEGAGAVVYKPLVLFGNPAGDFDQVPGDPGHYISKEKVRTFAPTDDANLSWTTSTDPNLLVNNLQHIHDIGLTEPEANLLILDNVSYDKLLGPNNAELLKQGVVYPNGKVDMSLSFRPAIGINTLFTGVLQDVMAVYRGVAEKVSIGAEILGGLEQSVIDTARVKVGLHYPEDNTNAEVGCEDAEFNFHFLGGFDGADLSQASETVLETLINTLLNKPFDLQMRADLMEIEEDEEDGTSDNGSEDDQPEEEVLPCAFAKSPSLYTIVSYISNSRTVKYYNNKLPRISGDEIFNPEIVVHGNISGQALKGVKYGDRIQSSGSGVAGRVRDIIDENIVRNIDNLDTLTGGQCVITGLGDSTHYTVEGCDEADHYQLFKVGEEIVMYFKGSDVTIDLEYGYTYQWIIVVDGGDIYIDGDSYNGPVNHHKLSLIAFKDDEYEKGNVYIASCNDPNKMVNNIQATIVADGSLFSYDSVGGAIDESGLPVWANPKARANSLGCQLFIEGAIYSENTIGGADLDKGQDPKDYLVLGGGEVVNLPASLDDRTRAQEYDLNYLRLFRLKLEIADNGLPIDQKCGTGLSPAQSLAISNGETVCGDRVPCFDTGPADQEYACNGIDPFSKYEGNGQGGDLVSPSDVEFLSQGLDNAPQTGTDFDPVYVFYVAPSQESFVFSKAGVQNIGGF